jgi:hypothetical protein
MSGTPELVVTGRIALGPKPYSSIPKKKIDKIYKKEC